MQDSRYKKRPGTRLKKKDARIKKPLSLFRSCVSGKKGGEMAFEDLDVWKRAKILSSKIYRSTAKLRDFGFRDQITRSGLSIPSNIAEGFERESIKDCINFLSYAKGSCGELRTQVYIGLEIGNIQPEDANMWIRETEEISSMIKGLIKTKRNQLPSK